MAAIEPGWDVYSMDDQKVGSVDSVVSNYILAHKGFFFPKDLYIPLSAVDHIEGRRVYLSVLKDSVEDQPWDIPPTETTSTTVADVGRVDTTSTRVADVDRIDTRTTTPVDAQDQATLHLREEQLQATKQQTQVGEVRIGKEVVEEERTMNVPVTREEVYIERQPGDRQPADHDIGERTEETIRVPVTEEQVNVEKVPVETEQIRVGTRQVTEQRPVTGTVRREEARIENEGDVRVEGDPTDIRDRDIGDRDIGERDSRRDPDEPVR
jgi:uncharacterized protein (TIGR02271 family)